MRDFDEVITSTDTARRRQADEEAVPQSLLGRAAAAGRPEAAGHTGLIRLQRAVGNAGTGAMLAEERSPVHDVVGSGGEALDRQTRTDMESALGQDFSDVRIHRDAAAHDSAAAVQAKAYTVGSHVVFQRDAFDPASETGRHTLAHELTHVVQQRSGPVDGTEAAGGIKVSSPSDRFEQEASTVADTVLSGGTAPATASAATGAAVQREGAPPEDELQTYVQRQAEGEAPEEETEESAPAAQTYVQRQESGEEEAEE
jgi:hypothetical protein